LRRGSDERKIAASYSRSAYPITGKSCATRDFALKCVLNAYIGSVG
jgi:hypothetical protein